MSKPSEIVRRIRAALGSHLLKGKYKKLRPADAPASWGTCYPASEALFFLWGRDAGFTPMRVPYNVSCGVAGQHWFLEHRPSGFQVDITADQFTYRKPTSSRVPDFKKAVPCGFLTKKPSKRAQLIIDSVLSV